MGDGREGGVESAPVKDTGQSSLADPFQGHHMHTRLPRQLRAGRSPFDEIVHTEEDGTEWWSARELMPHLGYLAWRNLENVISKARSACRNSGHQVADHFADVGKNLSVGRPATDVQLTRFGCYLVAMNGDPDKPEVAAAQRYFALMTRAAEKGVTPPPVAVEAPRPWSERIRETTVPHIQYINVHHPGCFSVISTLATQLLFLEDELIRHMLKPQPSDRPDVSIGIIWAGDRRKRGLPDSDRTAPLWLPDQNRRVFVRVYDNSERGDCETWFHREYLPSCLPDYLMRKPSFKAFGELPPASAADHTCRELTGRPAVLKPRVRKLLVAAGGTFKAGDALPMLEPPQKMLFDL